MPRNRTRGRARSRSSVLLLGAAGSVAVSVGVFAPALAVESLFYDRELSYWSVSGAERLGVLVAAALVLPALRRRREAWLVAAALALWCALLLPWLRDWLLPERRGLLERIGDAARRPLEEMTTQVVLQYDMLRLRWGAWCLLAGALAMTRAGWLALRRT